MKKIELFFIVFFSVIILSSCNSASKNDVVTESSKIETSSPEPTLEATEEPTPSPTSTPTPTMTLEEKANLLSDMSKEYISKSNGSIETDEFTNSVSVTIPDIESTTSMTGDNAESILMSSYIFQSASGDDETALMLFASCTHEGDLVMANEIILKTSDKKIVLENVVSEDPDIELGYVIETSMYNFKNDIEKIEELQELLKEKNIRVRFSGDSNIDFTLSDKVRKALLNCTKLYIEFYNKINN